jgi:serine/threonine-protein kinase
MERARWDRLEALCASALEVDPAERVAYLARACGDDAGLRRDAERLLEQLESDPSFLERPLVDLSDLAADPADSMVPGEIGPYRLHRLLGRGGMGDVYLATHEAEDVRRSVAVKVIRPGRNTDEVLRRFRLERRILAGLQHPNIARLEDAGATPDGRPYFVMEYVAGLPIDAYCDEHRLSIERRLELVQVVCGAVQHAHQALVVHRDLKPTNILVGQDGVPKLLDFGIGKVLGDGETFGTAVETSGDVRPLTPAYAAPEQLAARPITTATDIHGLGVLLYELLAGRHPFVRGGETLREIERAVADTDPIAPSVALHSAERDTARAVSARRASDPGQLRRRLTGDLDNIVLKALRKEPERRYPSAAALADDLRRHVRRLPVSARPDTFGYRARKFIRRNASWVAAATIAFAALGATTAVTLVQSRRVAQESERVIQERDKALEVRGFLMEMFGATGADQAIGDSVTARQLLDLQAARIDQAYPDRPELRAEMLEVLADGYDRLGLYRAAEPLARTALDLRRETLGARHPDVAASLNQVGWLLYETGDAAAAEPILAEAVSIRRAAGPRYALDLSRSLNDHGIVLVVLGRYDDAEAHLHEALEIRQGALGDGHRSVGITASNLATAYYHRSRVDEAVRLQELAVHALQRSVGPDHQRSVVALGNLAVYRLVGGDWDAAVTDYRELLARQTRIQGRDHPVTITVMTSLATALAYQAGGSGNDSGFAEAEGLLRKALAIREATLGAAHPEVAGVLDALGNILSTRGKVREALAAQQRAVEIYRGTFGEVHARTAGALYRLATIHWTLNDVEGALRTARSALRTYDATLGPTHVETVRARVSWCERLSYERDIARETVDECTAAVEALATAPAGQQGQLTRARLWLAQAHLATGDVQAADSVLAEVRATDTTSEAGSPERQALDSLTALIAERQ